MTATCQERITVDAWHTKTCGRPVKEDGLCGIHLAAKRKRRELDRKWLEKDAAGKALQQEAATLSGKLGIDVAAHYDSIRREYSGRFVVPGDWLRKISEAAP